MAHHSNRRARQLATQLDRYYRREPFDFSHARFGTKPEYDPFHGCSTQEAFWRKQEDLVEEHRARLRAWRDSSRYYGSGKKLYKAKYHAKRRQESRQLAAYALRGDWERFDRINPESWRGRIHWDID